jgi:hypothetical protein
MQVNSHGCIDGCTSMYGNYQAKNAVHACCSLTRVPNSGNSPSSSLSTLCPGGWPFVPDPPPLLRLSNMAGESLSAGKKC